MPRYIIVLLWTLIIGACAAPRPADETVTLTIMGLNDVHGELLPADSRGGLVSVSAFAAALRQQRAADGGALLLIDAGDMWQGTLESNLGEGAAVVEAYNALGVAAATIGNHEFDFGPAGPASTPKGPHDAPRGALRERAREMRFPLLAANLIDESTGLPVAWDNVRPAVMLDAAGLRVGVIGVMTEEALQTTISANTQGLRVAPLAPTVEREARTLREQGADVVIVAAHAGSRCEDFSNPEDTSSCNLDGEIMRVAAALPAGLVDHIVAGHVHQGIAHVVNGISINAAYSNTRAFSRTDLHVFRDGRGLAGRTVYPPQPALLDGDPVYEGIALQEDPAIVAIADNARAAAEEKKNAGLGVVLAAPFELVPDVESALSNLMTEALLDALDGDIAIHNVFGGIRNGLPAGELTFGAVYQMFPFDNVVTVHEISGKDLRAIVARMAAQRRKPGFSGMRVFVGCGPAGMRVTLRRDDGREITDSDKVRVIANDFLALGGDDILTPAIPEQGLPIDQGLPRTRDVLVQWFIDHPGELDPAEFRTHDAPKWNLPDIIPETCAP